ncbi:MAG TPA: L-2-hydroxyglutarate oxidase [Planctomycetaceae bacterium]|nr:L-2-hydroxyglutarate oxidase [Planctomycetaceae bacterium]
MTSQVDFIIVGGGIVGLATAWRLVNRFPDSTIRLIEKEPEVAAHQSGRNSGVLHSGIYYKPGSLKASTCREGRVAMIDFCEQEGIEYETCGKIIVATDEDETQRLDNILARGIENGIDCSRIDVNEMHEIEPHVSGVAAIHVRTSGIADYPGVCRRIAERLREKGNYVCLGERVQQLKSTNEGVEVTTNRNSYRGGFLLTCGGLHSDKLVGMAGHQSPAKIVPFRGEYYELHPEHRGLCKHLIYPVPDPNFPFLGVHFTRMVSGDVECGPNAVFALAREGYNWRTIRLSELFDALTYPGFLKLAGRHWRMGMGEIHRSLSKQAFVKALQKLIPEIRAEHLKPCRAGVRAQAMTKDGTLVDDFLWVEAERSIHVCNAPSPAATASLEIGRHIVDKVQSSL